MEQLHIYTLIHNRYPIYDQSGQLPFSIVFGLCRRSSDDTDPRPLIIDTRVSAFDIPYALANNLIKLKVDDKEPEESLALTIKRLCGSKETDTYLSIPCPVDRHGTWKTSMVTYRYQIRPGSELASLFKPAKKYEIMLSSDDLGVKWCKYGDLSNERTDEAPVLGAESLKLLAKPSHGRCKFTAVSSIPQPPRIHTQLALETIQSQDKSNYSARLRISVTNTGSAPVTVQTRNTQRYLVPWGPMEPEERLEARPRIIDANTPAPLQNLLVVDKATGDTARSPPPLEPSGPGNAKDPRPRLETLVTLKPTEPLVRFVDIGMLFQNWADGVYQVQLVSRGMWWCEGDVDEFAEAGDDRVSQGLWDPVTPPIRLESDDCVEVRVESGQVAVV